MDRKKKQNGTFWLISVFIAAVSACDNMLSMPTHCYCKGTHLICDSLQANWTGKA